VAGATGYQWILPPSWLGSSVVNSINISIGSNSGVLQIKAQNVCGSSPSTTFALLVNPTITVTQPLTICNGDKIIVGNSTYSTSGNYSNNLTRINGCDSVVKTQLTVKPAIDISTSNSGFDISSNAGGAGYQWINCETKQAIAGQTNQDFSPTQNGNYAVIVSQNGCSDTSDCVSFLTVNLNALFIENQIKIYPNPSTNKILIESTLNSGSVQLVNDLGQVLTSTKITNGKKETIDLSNFANGTYYIKIVSEDKSYTKKVIRK
jgi:hypothetical protein